LCETSMASAPGMPPPSHATQHPPHQPPTTPAALPLRHQHTYHFPPHLSGQHGLVGPWRQTAGGGRGLFSPPAAHWRTAVLHVRIRAADRAREHLSLPDHPALLTRLSRRTPSPILLHSLSIISPRICTATFVPSAANGGEGGGAIARTRLVRPLRGGVPSLPTFLPLCARFHPPPTALRTASSTMTHHSYSPQRLAAPSQHSPHLFPLPGSLPLPQNCLPWTIIFPAIYAIYLVCMSPCWQRLRHCLPDSCTAGGPALLPGWPGGQPSP